MPNQTGNPAGNFVTSYSTGGNVDQYNERIDYAMSSRQRIFGRYTQSHILSLPRRPFSGYMQGPLTRKIPRLSRFRWATPSFFIEDHLGPASGLQRGTSTSARRRAKASTYRSLVQTGRRNVPDDLHYIPDVCVSQTNGDNHWGQRHLVALKELEAASAHGTIPQASTHGFSHHGKNIT